MPDLTARQAAFAQEYLVDLNGAQAAVRAGYAKRDAKRMATRLLATNVHVKALVAEGLAERKRRLQLSADATLDEIRALSHSDPRTIFNEDGTVKPPSQWSDECARTIAGFEVREEYGDVTKGEPAVVKITKVKFWSKEAGLQMKGRAQKLFTDVLDVKLDDATADRLARARAKVKAEVDEASE